MPLAFILFCLSDWAFLWALPHLHLSFSPGVHLPLAASLFTRTLIFGALVGATLLARFRGLGLRARVPGRGTLALFLFANLSFSLLQVDAYVIEPLWVETTELLLSAGDLDAAAPSIRVVHLTDIHVERTSFRESAIIRQVNALQPDIVVLTGDYLNLSYLSDPASAAAFRHLVDQIQAPYGIYAVRGSVEPTPDAMARLVEGTEIVWLEQEAVTVDVRGQAVTLVGVACSHHTQVDTARLEQATAGIPGDAYTILLYHSPDLIHQAARMGIDLYLGGHTHGGQLRLPWYGAIVTGSRFGKQYTSGQFQVGGTTMYISRGLGFEGGGMPRARFLCRPEIVSIELEGSQ